MSSLKPTIADDGTVSALFETVYPTSMAELSELLRYERQSVVIRLKHDLRDDACKLAAVVYHDGVLWLNMFAVKEVIQPWGIPATDASAITKLKELIDITADFTATPAVPSSAAKPVDEVAEPKGTASKRKRGRSKGSVAAGGDPAFDKRVAEAWAKGKGIYRRFTEVAAAFGISPYEAKRAKERHRDRVRGKSGTNRAAKPCQAK